MTTQGEGQEGVQEPQGEVLAKQAPVWAIHYAQTVLRGLRAVMANQEERRLVSPMLARFDASSKNDEITRCRDTIRDILTHAQVCGVKPDDVLRDLAPLSNRGPS